MLKAYHPKRLIKEETPSGRNRKLKNKSEPIAKRRVGFENELQANIQASLERQGMSPAAAKLVAQGLGQLTAAGIGATVGGTQGAATALTVDTRAFKGSDPEVSPRIAVANH